MIEPQQQITNIAVVGATSAIAQAALKQWCAPDKQFFLVARDHQKLKRVARELRARGAYKVHTWQLDVLNMGAHQQVVQAIDNKSNVLQYILIAHGMLPAPKEARKGYKTAQQVFQVNATATISLATLFANILRKQETGIIGIIGSVAGDRGRKGNYPYGASKAAVATFVEGLRMNLSSSNAHALLIKPGFVDTPMTRHLSQNFLFSSPERIGKDIVQAFGKNKKTIYSPFWWRAIMWGIRWLPETILRQLNL